jgi:deazaflavin-dependent oxidoreductase (nitroreductase family)
MTPKPNAVQRLVYRFLMLRSVTALLSLCVQRLDLAVLRLTGGKYFVSELIGWHVIELHTLGAKTNQPRTNPLFGLLDGEKIALVASSFGRVHNPGWYYNLKAHPECTVKWKGSARQYVAREAEGNEYDKYWEMAVNAYEGYAKYRERAARHIPVMVLEPKR